MTEILISGTGSDGPISAVATCGQLIIAYTTGGIITCARLPMPGTTVTQTFTVNDASTPATWPQLAGLVDGFAVVWTSGHDLFLQRMGADGTKIAGPFKVNSTGVDPTNPPTITRLIDGALVVAWGDDTSETVRARIYRGDLSPFGPPFQVNVPTDGVYGITGEGVPHYLVNVRPVVTGLAVGDADWAFVVAWQRGMAVETTTAHFRYFLPNGDPEPPPPGTPPNSDGTPVKVEHMSQYDLLCSPQTLIAVPGGGFFGLRLIQTSLTDPSAGNTLVADSYSSTGDHEVLSNITHRADQTSSTHPAITMTPTNDYIVVWAQSAEHVAGDPGRSILAMPAGIDMGDTAVVTINNSPPGDLGDPCIACVVTDTGYVTGIAWLDGRSVKARVFFDNELHADV